MQAGVEAPNSLVLHLESALTTSWCLGKGACLRSSWKSTTGTADGQADSAGYDTMT